MVVICMISFYVGDSKVSGKAELKKTMLPFRLIFVIEV